jgi:hypothetical protein
MTIKDSKGLDYIGQNGRLPYSLRLSGIRNIKHQQTRPNAQERQVALNGDSAGVAADLTNEG